MGQFNRSRVLIAGSAILCAREVAANVKVRA